MPWGFPGNITQKIKKLFLWIRFLSKFNIHVLFNYIIFIDSNNKEDIQNFELLLRILYLSFRASQVYNI